MVTILVRESAGIMNPAVSGNAPWTVDGVNSSRCLTAYRFRRLARVPVDVADFRGERRRSWRRGQLHDRVRTR